MEVNLVGAKEIANVFNVRFNDITVSIAYQISEYNFQLNDFIKSDFVFPFENFYTLETVYQFEIDKMLDYYESLYNNINDELIF